MAAIRTQGGNVLLRGGRVSCACCDEDIVLGQFDFGEQGVCDCETVLCYSATNLSPSTSNLTPGTFRRTTNRFFVQGASFDNAGNVYPPFTSVISSPSIMRLFGSVGGDVAVNVTKSAPNGAPPEDATIPSGLDIVDFIPNEGEYPCGVCDTPRNGVHNIDYFFPLYPKHWFYVDVFSFVACQPWVRLKLRRVGAYTPP